MEVQWLLLLTDIFRRQNVEVLFYLRNFFVCSLDMSGEFHWQLDYTSCCETIYKDIALLLHFFLGLYIRTSRLNLEMSRQNQRTNFVMTNFCFLCCIRTKNVEAVKKLSNLLMVVFTTYDRQVYYGFVYLVDFPKLLPGRILSAVRLKNLSASKNCRVTTNHPHL